MASSRSAGAGAAAGFLFLALLFSALFTDGAAALFLPNAAPSGRCPVNALGFSVCSTLLGGLVNVSFGNLPRTSTSCCALIGGLAAFDAETCLCTAFDANVFGGAYALNATGGVSLLLNYCGRNSTGYQC